jgi:hypothetical protein
MKKKKENQKDGVFFIISMQQLNIARILNKNRYMAPKIKDSKTSCI